MTTIPPTLPPAPASPVPPAVVTATPVSEVPAQIAALPPNTTIEATVAAATQAVAQAQARAVVQLMTALGNVTVRLPMPVPPNATLRLQVLGSGANLQLRVIAINGQPVQGGLTPASGEIGSSPLPPLAGPLAGNAQSAAGANPLTAQLPSGNPGAAGATGELIPPTLPGSGLTATIVFGTDPGLPNGTQLTVRLLDIAPTAGGNGLPPPPGALDEPLGAASGAGRALPMPLPGADAMPLPGGATPASAAGTPADPSAAPGPPSADAIPSTAPAATPLNAPAAPSANLAPAAVGATTSTVPATLAGLVAPNSLGGQPLIQTPIGLISLAAGPDLSPGSHVLLETVGPPTLPAGLASTAQPAQAGAPSGWTAFGEAMAVLQKADPTAAQMLVQRLPDLGPQFVSNLVTWVAAAQTGDMRAWLGERTVKALEKAGRADLLERLDSDMGEMRTPVSLPQMGNEWQALTLPLFFGQRVERVRLTLRRPKGDDETEGRDEEGLRFLLDLDMSRLGALQLDGLVKRHAKRFDLIVRSRLELSDAVQRDIGGIFARSLDGLGMTGGAVFKQTVAFVEPIPVQASRAGLMI